MTNGLQMQAVFLSVIEVNPSVTAMTAQSSAYGTMVSADATT